MCAAEQNAWGEEGENMPYEPSIEPKSRPDRTKFQQHLSRLSQLISVAREGKKAVEGEQKILKDCKLRVKGERSSSKTRVEAFDREVKVLREQETVKKREQESAERTIIIKDGRKVNNYLEKYEEEFRRSQFSSGRTEAALIAEIDKLKLNRLHLTKYNQLGDELRVIQSKIREKTRDRKETYRNFLHSRSEEKDVLDQLKHLKNQWQVYNAELHKLYKEKSEVVSRYNMSWDNYKTWRSANPPSHMFKSWSQIAGGKYGVQDEDNDSDDGDLYWKEKRNCRVLLDYLRNLIKQIDDNSICELAFEEFDDSPSTPPNELSELTRPKLDVPEGMTLLKKKEESVENLLSTSPRHKKRQFKRKKASQAIDLSVEMYNSFVSLDLNPPQQYSDVSELITRIEDIQQMYEEHVSIPDPHDPFYYPPSEMSDTTTVDSALASFSMSDCESLSLTQDEYVGHRLSHSHSSQSNHYYPSSPSPIPLTSSPTISGHRQIRSISDGNLNVIRALTLTSNDEGIDAGSSKGSSPPTTIGPCDPVPDLRLPPADMSRQ